MDKYLLWHQLSLIQQLNCVCNTTAKASVHSALTTGYTSTPTQILSREDISIVFWGNKITSDISQPVQFHASKELARKLLTDTKKWPQEWFKEVDWEHLDLAMTSKSDMYKMWSLTRGDSWTGKINYIYFAIYCIYFAIYLLFCIVYYLTDTFYFFVFVNR
jgi:hypothetical protein